MSKTEIETERHSDSTQWISGCFFTPLSLLVTIGLFMLLDMVLPDIDWEDGSFWNPVLGIIILLVFIFVMGVIQAALTSWLHQSEHKQAQKEKYQQAIITARQIAEGINPDAYFLYLRSFKIESLTCNWYWKPIEYSSDSLYTTTIDEEMAYALGLVNIQLICLGETETVKTGAARLKTADADWRHKINSLQKHATGIIVCIGSTESLIEEVKTIYSDKQLADKTAFIMLPQKSYLLYRVIWAQAQKKLAAYGITLPEYINEGMLFNASGYRQPLLSFDCKSPLDLARAFLNVIDSEEPPRFVSSNTWTV